MMARTAVLSLLASVFLLVMGFCLFVFPGFVAIDGSGTFCCTPRC